MTQGGGRGKKLWQTLSPFLASILIIVILGVCAAVIPTGGGLHGVPAAAADETPASVPVPSEEPPAAEPESPASPATPTKDPSVPSGETPPADTSVPAETAPVDTPTSAETAPAAPPAAETAPEHYDYAAPVPLATAVDNAWFADAVFLGDSRTQGLMLYSGLTEATYLTGVGLMVDTAFTEPLIGTGDSKVPVMDALAGLRFSKVYIMLGVNELGWQQLDVFQADYAKIVDRVLELNPEAQVYIQSILPVTAEKSDGDAVYNNTNIERFNALLRALAADRQVYYLDVAAAVADTEGCLPKEGSFDGVHLVPDYCVKWLDYLKIHTVSDAEPSAREENATR